MRIWLDDIRLPPDATWAWAKTADSAIHMLRLGTCTELSLDNDLGEHKPEGRTVIAWLAMESANDNNLWPSTKPTVHSANPVAAEYMRAMIDRYGPYGEDDPGDSGVREPSNPSDPNAPSEAGEAAEPPSHVTLTVRVPLYDCRLDIARAADLGELEILSGPSNCSRCHRRLAEVDACLDLFCPNDEMKPRELCDPKLSSG